MKKIGIMIPCYNEQENIVQICNAVVKEITEELPQYEYESLSLMIMKYLLWITALRIIPVR